jgi:amidase
MLSVLTAIDPEDPETSAPGRRTPADWRAVLDVNALRGKRIGYIPSTWVDPLGTTGTIDASKAALKYFVEAGARIVEMGVTAGGTDLPPAPPAPPGDVRSEGWRQYIDKHPELVQQGFQMFTAVDVNCSQKKVAYVRADPTSPGCQRAAASPRMAAAEIQAFREYRRGRQSTAKIWMDTGGADRLGVDAIVYPGLLSDISLNDGGGSKASFGRRDTPSAANGIPTIVFPAGYNNHGEPIDLQLLGRAWDDDKLVAMAYAFEHYANAASNGHVEPATVPRLKYRR